METREIKFRVWHRKENKMYYRGYQKVSHVLLCEDDQGKNEGKGNPVKRASYEDCEFLETTSLFDKNGREIFEGDIVRVKTYDLDIRGTVGGVPDMFRSRKIHPLQAVFSEYGIDPEEDMEIEVVGNRFEK